jgi:hypothetical protein
MRFLSANFENKMRFSLILKLSIRIAHEKVGCPIQCGKKPEKEGITHEAVPNPVAQICSVVASSM